MELDMCDGNRLDSSAIPPPSQSADIYVPESKRLVFCNAIYCTDSETVL